MRIALCIASLALLPACVPEDHPPWLIDHAMAWGILASVVEPGGYSSELPVAAGRVRAAALPLDTLELQWLAVAPPGPELPPPVWIVCGRDCRTYWPRTPVAPTCPDPLPLSRTEHCRLGEGARIRLALGGAYTADPEFRGTIGLLAIGSGDPDLDSQTCFQRLTTDPARDLERCLIQQHFIVLGPASVLFANVPALDQQFTVEGEVPDDLADELADTHPVLTGLHVVRATSDGEAEQLTPVGGTVRVRAGEQITVTPKFTADSLQDYYEYRLVNPDKIHITRHTEHTAFEAAITALVAGFEHQYGDDAVAWIAPDDPEPITLHLLITDSREGMVPATLTFITDPAAP